MYQLTFRQAREHNQHFPRAQKREGDWLNTEEVNQFFNALLDVVEHARREDREANRRLGWVHDTRRR